MRPALTLVLAALYSLSVTASPALKPTSALGSSDDDPIPTVVPETPPTPQSPARAVNGGLLVCEASYIAGDYPKYYMARDEAADAINKFCGRISDGTVFKQGGTPLQTMQNDGPYGYTMAIHAIWAPYPKDRTDCPTLDFIDTSAVAVCKESLLKNVIDNCNTHQGGRQFWKGGGRYLKDCITWEIMRADLLAGPVPTNTTSYETQEDELR